MGNDTKLRILNILKKIVHLFKIQFRLNYFGFVQGHWDFKKEDIDGIKKIYLNGSDCVIGEFESKFASLIGEGNAICFATGRMAFYATMKALNIGAGDEVILLGFTCSVMPNAVLRTGAKPIYSDVDPETYGSSAKNISPKINSRTKLIVAQHSFGIPCNIEEIVELAKKHNIKIIEDCAISFDSKINGKKVGSFGDASIFSTDHTKPINTIIGGMIYTDDHRLHERIKNIRDNSPDLTKEHHERLFKRFLIEKKYYSYQRYNRALMNDFIKDKIHKIKNSTRRIVFFEEDYYNPLKHSYDFYSYPAKFPAFLAKIGLIELAHWDCERDRRKAILNKFLEVMKNSSHKNLIPKVYFSDKVDIVPLRFVFTTNKKDKIVSKMKKFIDMDWIWFRNPIISTNVPLEEFGYLSGSCKLSEEIGSKIVNFPCNLSPDSYLGLFTKFKQLLK